MIPEIILASASPRRADILKKYGITFRQISSGAEEPGAFFADDAAMMNARVKAKDLSRQYPDKIVLAADTVIEFEQSIIGKLRIRTLICHDHPLKRLHKNIHFAGLQYDTFMFFSSPS